MLAKATPHSSAGAALEATIATSQRLRQTASSCLLRYSSAITRTIKATRISVSAR